jgi:uncharacterized Zn finger protein
MSEATADHTCPTCTSDDVERVHRERAIDHVARAIGWRVYRCCECGNRFYDRPARRQAS